MHIVLGALIGAVISVTLTFVTSQVIRKPLSWKDLAASAVAGIVGGGVASATLGVGAAGTARLVTAFAAGGATGSASGQVTDNVLNGQPARKDLVKSTLFGTAIGAATLGVGKAVAPASKHLARAVGLGRASPGAASSGHGGNSFLAGTAAGLDDAIVPVVRYVKKALKDPAESAESESGVSEEGASSGSWGSTLGSRKRTKDREDADLLPLPLRDGVVGVVRGS